jgi:hypothetical protein
LMKWPMAVLPLVAAILSGGAGAVEPALRRSAEAEPVGKGVSPLE